MLARPQECILRPQYEKHAFSHVIIPNSVAQVHTGSRCWRRNSNPGVSHSRAFPVPAQFCSTGPRTPPEVLLGPINYEIYRVQQ